MPKSPIEGAYSRAARDASQYVRKASAIGVTRGKKSIFSRADKGGPDKQRMLSKCVTGQWLVAIAAVLVFSGCSENSPTKGGANGRLDGSRFSAQLLPARTPSDVANLLQSHHAKRSYSEIAKLVVREKRDATIAALLAIDDVLAANEMLHRTAGARFNGALPGYWNLAVMENNLGPFSTDVNIINERIRNDTAMVTLQEGDNLPLFRAEFELVDGEWLYRPESMPVGRISELKRLARILRDVRESIFEGAAFGSLTDAYRYRVLPQIARIERGAEAGVPVAAAVEEPDEP